MRFVGELCWRKECVTGVWRLVLPPAGSSPPGNCLMTKCLSSWHSSYIGASNQVGSGRKGGYHSSVSLHLQEYWGQAVHSGASLGKSGSSRVSRWPARADGGNSLAHSYLQYRVPPGMKV